MAKDGSATFRELRLPFVEIRKAYPENYSFPIMPMQNEVNLGPGKNMIFIQLEMNGKNYFLGIIGNCKSFQNADLIPLINQITTVN